ncbi:hypothetical protein [Nonomuraea sp. NPDC050783]|uniref:hypothetical protein n=1 Tax=Nonomuraea sp. NPDC050783 TaxID=3154634 RepID=UPI0034678321
MTARFSAIPGRAAATGSSIASRSSAVAVHSSGWQGKGNYWRINVWRPAAVTKNIVEGITCLLVGGHMRRIVALAIAACTAAAGLAFAESAATADTTHSVHIAGNEWT